MKFYLFDQNDSGGSFVFDYKAGIVPFVIIEAEHYVEANRRAEEIGIYFNGVADGKDDVLDGDRWYLQGKSDGVDVSWYGGGRTHFVRWEKDFQTSIYQGDDPSKIACFHYKDGSMKWHGIGKNKK